MARFALSFAAAALVTPLVSYAGDHPLSSCFWSGPISTKQPTALAEDGARFLWPEESASYWLARYKELPAGAHLEIKRDFACARHESLNAYRTEETPTGPRPARWHCAA